MTHSLCRRPKVLILYGTLTGDTKAVAYALHAALQEEFPKYKIDILNVRELRLKELLEYPLVIFGTSTWDDGINNPDAHNFLVELGESNLNLANTRFALFGLGDSMYMHFCKALDLFRPVLQARGAHVDPEQFTIDGYPTDEAIAEAAAWAQGILKAE